jgi:hypothetical protein
MAIYMEAMARRTIRMTSYDFHGLVSSLGGFFFLYFFKERRLSMKLRHRIVFVFLVIVIGIGTSYAQENNSIHISPLNLSSLEESSFLEGEAGISAYGQVNYVDLDLAENAFKYVEKKTENYIIGAVSLSGYDETHDVHVYVDTSLWIIAYYLGQEKPGKIIDWIDYYSTGTIGVTKLEKALNKVVGEMSAFLPSISYYDFRYPNATNIAIITDEEEISGATETFRFMVPNDHFLHSKTWSHSSYQGRGGTCQMLFDSTQLNAGGDSSGWAFFEGDIPGGLLIYDTFHEISLIHYDNTGGAKSFAGIVLIYSEL